MTFEEIGPVLQSMPPDNFVAIAESTDLACDAGQLVLDVHAKLAFFVLHPSRVHGLHGLGFLHKFLANLHAPVEFQGWCLLFFFAMCFV